MKTLLCILGLTLLVSGNAQADDGKALAEWLQKPQQMKRVKRIAYKKFGRFVVLDFETLECIGWSESSGTCTMHGDSGGPNSSTIFAVTVKKPNYADCDYETTRIYFTDIDGEC